MKLVYLHTNSIASNQANITQVLYMCDALSGQDMEVELIVPNSGKDLSETEKDILINKKISKKREFNINEYSVSGLLPRFKVINNYLGLRKKILDTKADAYFTRTPIILPLLSKTNKKIIFESHSPLLQNSFSFVDALYKSSLYKQMQKNKKLAMITISSALKEYWVDKSFEHSRIFVLHDSFDGSKSLTHVSNDEFRIKKESTVISYVGSLYEDRGIERIFELSKIFSNCQFLVAGGPKKQKEHLEIKAKEIGLDNLKFLGWLDRKDVDKLLLSSDILLMLWSSKVPTINYCSPMKVFEYMSSGKIIVGDGYPTIKEVLTDGIDSHLSTPESLDSMISKLYKAINQIPDFTMGEKAKKLAYEKYTWENRASEIKKIIDNI